MDLEALEAENDRGIAALSERVGTLRGITTNIHGEVESQHRLLDNLVGAVAPPLRAAGCSLVAFQGRGMHAQPMQADCR